MTAPEEFPATGSGHGEAPGRAYLLGHSQIEIDRLIAQAVLIDPITRRFFEAAGIGRGMRVLDVGSGAGDVAFLVGALVGDSGQVVGVDRSETALETARAQATSLALRNVSFRAGDPGEMSFDRPFDAVVGRYVLQFQPDPAAMLRRISTHVRPEGSVAFHEIDWGGLASYPEVPTFEKCRRWGIETLRRHGTETDMGRKLYSTFVAAGLPAPSMRLEAIIRGGPAAADLLRLVAGLMATLLPEMERLGVASATEVALDTLVERMTAECHAGSSVVMGHLQIAAWSRM